MSKNEIHRILRDRIVRDHGIVDSKGRKVGGYATIRTYSEPNSTTEDSYLVTTFATRDGKQFGSSFPSGTVIKGDIEVARALAEKKLDAQGRRQAKAHAAPAAPKAAVKADNPSCPKCGRYNAMLRGFTQLACRDCGHTMPLA